MFGPLERLRRDAHALAVSLRANRGEPAIPEEIAKHAVLLGPSGEMITSPYHLAAVELLRDEILGGERPANAVPCDVFVFGLGAPPAPHLTKIGGRPYRARSRPWPKTSDGRDLLFIGQLSFVDSRDLFPNLEGDVLLVFADPEHLYDRHTFEWVRVGEGESLDEGDVPEVWHMTYTKNPFRHPDAEKIRARVPSHLEVYGVIHRSWDLLADDARFASLKLRRRVERLEGTKIGGVPVEIQGVVADRSAFLASIGSVQPEADRSFPWVDQEASMTSRETHRLGAWMLGDAGTLNVFRDATGSLRSQGDCY